MAVKSTPQIWAEYMLARSILVILGVLPRRVSVGIGFAVAWVGYRIFGKLRRVGLRSIEIAFPEMPEAERVHLLKRSFKSLGRTLGMVASFNSLTRENLHKLIDVELDPEFEAEFKKLRDEKRGFIVLTAHLGNWELFAITYSMLFGPSNLLSRKMDNPKLDAMIEGMRSRFGNRQIDKSGSASRILRILRNGENVGILADANTHPKEGVFVPFFGVDACTTAGPALLAQRANGAIVPLFAVWNEASARYSLINGPIIEPVDTGDREADIAATTAKFTAVIEDVIRRYPDQWVWIHRRWKSRPAGQPELY